MVSPNFELSWELCQNFSDKILNEGLYILKNSPLKHWREIDTESSGNYLISNSGIYNYMGEADHLSERIKQQFNPKSKSSFFINYQSWYSKYPDIRVNALKLDDFSVQIIETALGRKELEEFGIVNLPSVLNKFQINKRVKATTIKQNGLWELVQKNAEKLILEGKDAFSTSIKSFWGEAFVPSSAGIYSVSGPNGKLIYIGESSNLNQRYQTHSSRTYFSALRRNIGTIIMGFNLQTKNKKRRYFDKSDDDKVTEFIVSCNINILEIGFGRFELEKYLIGEYKPLVNKKDSI